MKLLKEINRVFQRDYISISEATKKLVPEQVLKAVNEGEIEKAVILNSLTMYSTLEFSSIGTLMLYKDFTEGNGTLYIDPDEIVSNLIKLTDILYKDSYSIQDIVRDNAYKFNISTDASMLLYFKKRKKTIDNHIKFLSRVLLSTNLVKLGKEETLDLYGNEVKADAQVIKIFLITILLAEAYKHREVKITVEEHKDILRVMAAKKARTDIEYKTFERDLEYIAKNYIGEDSPVAKKSTEKLDLLNSQLILEIDSLFLSSLNAKRFESLYNLSLIKRELNTQRFKYLRR